MVADVEEICPNVVMVKVPLVAPCGMFIVAGTVATATLLLDRDTSAPPVGAGPLSVTVPLDVVPPGTPVGESTNDAAGNGHQAGGAVGQGDHRAASWGESRQQDGSCRRRAALEGRRVECHREDLSYIAASGDKLAVRCAPSRGTIEPNLPRTEIRRAATAIATGCNVVESTRMGIGEDSTNGRLASGGEDCRHDG